MTLLSNLDLVRLKYILIVIIVLLISAAAVFFFADPYSKKFSKSSNRAVYIRYDNGAYTLYRFGKPFFIRGAAGTSHLKELSQAGGNTIRAWDTTGLQHLLADAEANNIAVVVGLPMPYNDDMDAFYNNDAEVKAQFIKYRELVAKYKNSKAILFWCLGNELAFPVKPQYLKFYKAFNQLVDMIHHDDPDHPVTTTMINVSNRNLISIKLRTNIDLISFNIFGALRSLDADLKSIKHAWNGPFMITEWAIDGPWPGQEQTAWGAYIENTSNKKAEQYLNLYQHYMPLKNPHFLGSLAFYWGQKQETTPTWFSLFDKYGNKSASVNVMQYLWTGKWPAHKAPEIKYMLVDDLGARDNPIYRPKVTLRSKVWMADPSLNKNLCFEWFIQPEDWFRAQHFYNQKARQSLDSLCVSENQETATFTTPLKEGPYRIFVNIYDKNGYFASCNTPFYVVEDKITDNK